MGLLLEARGAPSFLLGTYLCCLLPFPSVVVSPHYDALRLRGNAKWKKCHVRGKKCQRCCQHVNLPDLPTLKKNNDNRTIANQHAPRLELGGDIAVGRCLHRSRSRGTCCSGIIAGIAHQHVPRLELGGSAAVGRCLRRSVRQTCRSGKSISIGGTIAHDKQNQV